ncbi:hypothetical protein AB9P05_21845 [Roseivirga sp. BDSF3-8]
MLHLRDPLGKLIRQIDLSRTNTKELTIDITFAPRHLLPLPRQQ